ncbi:prolyl oligopeptidase family serine peptidase [Mangrovicoccus sp. HB161399]|uniref:prolyl oligopeptidase family serine peptidase n=1 Tax=Mangrovicoccus sp. HB161399 TaxID=2720392 RepID=UPI001554DC45|nr:prolyl oligopeptidase family serine peptidase [Mangrovicoccus sp. HB161399]
MPTRRSFILGLTAAGALANLSAPVLAGGIAAQSASAVTQVFGGGLRFVAVAVTYPVPVPASALSAADFAVAGRTVTEVYPAAAADPASRAEEGPVVIVALSAEDADALLLVEPERSGGPGGPGGSGGGPGAAGERSVSDKSWKTPQATVAQAAFSIGERPVAAAEIATAKVENLVIDEFRQLVWNDPETGDSLPYNLFVPKDYDPAQRYPLVNFMHDAGTTSEDPLMTLKQGLGAICWASPQDQADRPCFVLAPQFAEIVASDGSETSSMLDTVINLIKALSEEYSIDTSRLYTTGQSGGGMLSIAMNIKYPDFFAASFLVACQWDAALVAPMAGNRLFILVSQDDAKAFPGQNAITEALETEGATVARAVWDAKWTAEQTRFAFDDLDAEGARINYVTFGKGTVFDEGEETGGASGHTATWRYAYSIAPIRDWIFRVA